MSEEAAGEFRYYEACTTLPNQGAAANRRTVYGGAGLVGGQQAAAAAGVAVKVASGAGDRCVSRPKRRATVRTTQESGDSEEDSLHVESIEWSSRSAAMTVAQLASSYGKQVPLLVKVTEHCDDFSRGQVG